MHTLSLAALASSSFLPHGYCIAWNPALLWTMVVADALIATSYFSIPLALVYFMRVSRRLQFDWILVMFSLFIFACGTTHLLGILDLWKPFYWLDASMLAVTAGVSLATAVALWPLLPRVLAYVNERERDRSELEQMNTRLQESLLQLDQRRVQAEASERRFRLILESAPNGLALLAPDGRWVAVNPALCAMLGYSEQEMLATRFQDVTHPEDIAGALCLMQELLDGRRPSYRYEKRSLHKDGHIVFVQLDVALMRDEQNQPLHAIVQVQDISERRRADSELRASRERFQLLVEGSVDYAMLMLNPDGSVASWNSGAERIEGYAAEDIIGRHYSAFYTPEDVAAGLPDEHLATAAREGRSEEEGWRVRKDGSRFWANALVTALRSSDGSLRGYAKLTRDLTERRRRDEAIRLALQEKDTLLKEVYHRVKNNLQVVSSLFNMQIRTLPEGPAQQALRDSADRVRAMALVHEKLYQSGSLASIDLAAYIEDLCQRLAGTAGAASRGIEVKCELARVQVGLDTAVPLGLILNELVSNALKHAFVDRAKGLVRVVLHALTGGGLRLAVTDDGVGMTEGGDALATSSLGLKLVHTLARQLDGRFLLEGHNGTCAALQFELRERS